MSFASIHPSDQRTNPAQFREKIYSSEKRSIFAGGSFASVILDLFFEKRVFLLNPMKSSQRFLGSKDGS